MLPSPRTENLCHSPDQGCRGSRVRGIHSFTRIAHQCHIRSTKIKRLAPLKRPIGTFTFWDPNLGKAGPSGKPNFRLIRGQKDLQHQKHQNRSRRRSPRIAILIGKKRRLQSLGDQKHQVFSIETALLPGFHQHVKIGLNKFSISCLRRELECTVCIVSV